MLRSTLRPSRSGRERSRFCFLAALLAAATLPGCAAKSAPAGVDLRCSGCSLVLISIDTLRSDHLSCYGYPRETSPVIDRFASRSLLFERAYAPSYNTADSHMSIFTGTNPSVHRVRNVAADQSQNRLPGTIRTLAEALKADGFTSVGFHGGGNVAAAYGFDRGFDSYRFTKDDLSPAVAWVSERPSDADQPFFLFVHTYRTHDPYLPDPPFNSLWLADYEGPVFVDPASFARELEGGDKFDRQRELYWSRVDPARPEDVAKVVALYDGEIRQVDSELAPLFDALERRPERILVVLVSDHGEQFYEHGGTLHEDVYEETLRVPFILNHPDGRGAGQRFDRRVSLVDLAPTLLDALGVAPLATAQGRSLLALLGGNEAAAPRAILAEKLLGDGTGPATAQNLRQALVVGDLKLIAPPGGRPLLFDLRLDPAERENRWATAPSDAERLFGALGRQNELNQLFWRTIPRSDLPVELDASNLEQLRALGYL